MGLKEKAAFLKGLAEGLDYNKETAEGKLISALIELADAMAAEIEGTQEDVDYLSEYVEEIDQDLGTIEEDFYGDDEDYEDDLFDEDDFEDEDGDDENPLDNLDN